MRKVLIYISIALGAILVLVLAILFIPDFDHTERFATTDPTEWGAGNAVSVVFPVPDTIREYELMVVLRCQRNFHVDNLSLAMVITAADSVSFKDTLFIDPPVRDIARKGHFEIVIPYRENVRFVGRFPYVFTFIPSVAVKGFAGIGVMANAR